MPTRIGVGGTSSGFDSSEYRVNTYGTPDYYCDCTRSLASNGAGTLGDPWNMSQAMANPVAGDVVGWLPVGAGTPVTLTATDNDNMPAFNPANSGTSGNPIVHVTKYAAVSLTYSSIATNQNRTEICHDGVAPTIVGGVGAGDGCAAYGANNVDYIIYDGFFTNIVNAYPKEDSGALRADYSTGVQFLNFTIKGTTVTMASNAVLIRGQHDIDTVWKNFYCADWVNDGTGSNTPQGSGWCDLYGSWNYLVAHGEIRDSKFGMYPKGTEPSNTNYNYGTLQYCIIHDVEQGSRSNDFDPTNLTTWEYNLFYNYSDSGLAATNETSTARNLLWHHNTVAKGGGGSINSHGALWLKANTGTSNVTIRDNLFDVTVGSGINANVEADAISTMPTLDYNGYYRGAGGFLGYFNAGGSVTNFATWQSSTGQDAHSQVLASDPFTNRASNDFTITVGHAAKTASSTGGEIGCYAGSETVGVVI